MEALVLRSPNFQAADPFARILTWPGDILSPDTTRTLADAIIRFVRPASP